MKRLFYAMRETRHEDIDDECLDQFLAATDQLSNAIHAIEIRSCSQQKKTYKLCI